MKYIYCKVTVLQNTVLTEFEKMLSGLKCVYNPIYLCWKLYTLGFTLNSTIAYMFRFFLVFR